MLLRFHVLLTPGLYFLQLQNDGRFPLVLLCSICGAGCHRVHWCVGRRCSVQFGQRGMYSLLVCAVARLAASLTGLGWLLLRGVGWSGVAVLAYYAYQLFSIKWVWPTYKQYKFMCPPPPPPSRMGLIWTCLITCAGDFTDDKIIGFGVMETQFASSIPYQ